MKRLLFLFRKLLLDRRVILFYSGMVVILVANRYFVDRTDKITL